MGYGARHVDKNVRADPVMYYKEAEYAGNAIFYGRTPGFDVLDSDEKWQIKLVTYEGGEIITRFANAGKYNCSWDDRATYFSSILPIVGPDFPADSTISGEVTISGLNIGGRVSEVAINDTTWTAVPASPLSDRNALSIQNYSGVEIKINYDLTGPLPAGYTGTPIANNAERFYDVTDNVIIYAKSVSGNVTITAEELS